MSKPWIALAAALTLTLGATSTAAAALPDFSQLSSDPYTNTSSEHATEVEPDTFASGTTIVGAFQAGRFKNGGSSNIGWAASTDSGASWTHGFLPSTTVYATPAGPYDRDTDPSVAYDAKDGRWLISSLGMKGTSGAAVIVSTSSDASAWNVPVTVATATGNQNFDKPWIVCDNTSTSPHYGQCYSTWDDNGNGNLLLMSTSTDGGLTWGAAKTTANKATGIGGQPLVQPGGKVIVPANNASETSIISFTSSDGGASWTSPTTVSQISEHVEAGSLRSGPLPTAEIDGSGRVYVVWSDCRFRTRCAENDLVVSTSTDGSTWSNVTQIPIDPTSSTVDHFLPGLAVDSSAASASASLALTYYYYPQTKCSVGTCQLDVGYISSTNGGSSWSAASQLAGPMQDKWLASTNQGYMVGDYISTSLVGGRAYPVVAVATAPSGGTLNESMQAPTGGLAVSG